MTDASGMRDHLTRLGYEVREDDGMFSPCNLHASADGMGASLMVSGGEAMLAALTVAEERSGGGIGRRFVSDVIAFGLPVRVPMATPEEGADTERLARFYASCGLERLSPLLMGSPPGMAAGPQDDHDVSAR